MGKCVCEDWICEYGLNGNESCSIDNIDDCKYFKKG